MSKYVGKIVTNQAAAGYSVAFDGTGDYLQTPAVLLSSSSPFTFECWAYWNSTGDSTNMGMLTSQYVSAGSGRMLFGSQSGALVLRVNGGTIYLTAPINAYTWYHVAWTYDGTTHRLFLNGALLNTSTTVPSLYTGTNTSIGGQSDTNLSGYKINGFISNVRISSTTALYTSSFTPPTQLFPTANTSLLTCQSPTIIDNSSNAFAITANGNAAVSTFTPFPAANIAPTSPNPLTPAPGVWTLDEAMQYTQQGVWPSYPANAIEDVFSTYLYTGTGATQTITNGIDLSTYGGLVWRKSRTQPSGAGFFHKLMDTARGTSSVLFSNTTDAATTVAELSSFNSNGFTMNAGSGYANQSGDTYASWTFRKQAKFFDVVTYTGNGSNRTISHNLGSVPGSIFVKRTDTTGDWQVYHRSLANTEYLVLNSTAAKATGTTRWNSTTPTSTEFSLGTDSTVNANSGTYVAYLFAHDAGGFGPAGTDNVISCGSVVGVSGGTSVSLGYEPQWLLLKGSSTASDWWIVDNMRGLCAPTTNAKYLPANKSDAEANLGVNINATGFTTAVFSTGETYIYIAIRRGPMRPPSSGTSVFTPIKTGSGSTLSDSYASIGFPIDMTLRYQTGTNISTEYKNVVFTRLLGINSGASDTPTSTNALKLLTPSTAAASTGVIYYSQTGSMGLDYGGSWNAPDYVITHLHFRRAPGFFDVVCYTGTGANRTVTHNLTVAPELMIVKRRDTTGNWQVYSAYLPSAAYILALNSTSGQASSGFDTVWNSTAPTASVFTVGTSITTNASAGTYVAYLFATVPGVSKVGSYTGTGTTQQINCGFTNGSRFVMIKRTDSTGGWYVYDSARGIVAGNDPYLFLNSTAAEVTNTDYVDTYSAGFELSSTAPAGLNASGGTYIFLAIA